MRCFFFDAIPSVGNIVRLDKPDHRHLFNTLRAKPGDQVELIDGHGITSVAVITQNLDLEVIARSQLPLPNHKIHLVVAIPRKNKMDTLLKQCAEFGVWSIQPIITERSVAKPEKQSVLERWETLLREGCKQSHNPFVPKISMPLDFADLFKHLPPEATLYFGSISGNASPEKLTGKSGESVWIVGPEGGLTQAETTLLYEHGAIPLCLGKYTLRTETAAIAGLAVLNMR